MFQYQAGVNEELLGYINYILCVHAVCFISMLPRSRMASTYPNYLDYSLGQTLRQYYDRVTSWQETYYTFGLILYSRLKSTCLPTQVGLLPLLVWTPIYWKRDERGCVVPIMK